MNYSILWIDDSPYGIEQSVGFLEQYGYNIKIASSVDSAIKLAKNGYDIFIVDVVMPNSSMILKENETNNGMTTGVALSKQLLQDNPSRKILGCSILNSDSIKRWFKKYCCGYINKNDISFNEKLLKKIDGIIVNTKNIDNVSHKHHKIEIPPFDNINKNYK